jgi:hypothetical protein
VLADTTHNLGTAHLLAAIGLTERQAAIFIATNVAAIRLQDALSKAPKDDRARAAVAQRFTEGLPTLVQRPIRKMLDKTDEGRITDSDIRTMGQKFARSLREYHASATAESAITSIANLAALAVWQTAQAQGQLPPNQKKYWRTQHDERVRHSHAQIESMNADGIPLDASFANPFGRSGLKAPPVETNCRCYVALSPQQ